MRVGILTLFHGNNNWGGDLQGYALKAYIEDNFKDTNVDLIKYRSGVNVIYKSKFEQMEQYGPSEVIKKISERIVKRKTPADGLLKKRNELFEQFQKSCMAGFVLKNTLSDNGGVTRGICKMDEQNNLTEVVETKNIVKTADGAEADGVAVDVNSLVSMNMWGLTPDFLDVLEKGFKEFFEKEVPGNPQKAEYLIPIFIGELLEQGKMSVKVLKTNDTWYGMTYHEDVAAVKDSFKKMLENGVYKADLFSDL